MSANRLMLGRRITSETVAYIDAMSIRPGRDEIIMLDRIIKRLIDCGAWGLLDCVYFLATGTDADSRINAKNPGTYNLTKVNSPIFASSSGWRSNSAGYLDSGFNPSTAGGRYTQNIACIGISVSIDVVSAGAIGYGSSALIIPHNGSNFQARINNAGSGNVAYSGIGLHAASRNGVTTLTQWRRGDKVMDTLVNSAAMSNANMCILTGNNGSSLSAASLVVNFAFWGAALNGVQQLEMQRAYAEYAAFYGIATS